MSLRLAIYFPPQNAHCAFAPISPKHTELELNMLESQQQLFLTSKMSHFLLCLAFMRCSFPRQSPNEIVPSDGITRITQWNTIIDYTAPSLWLSCNHTLSSPEVLHAAREDCIGGEGEKKKRKPCRALAVSCDPAPHRGKKNKNPRKSFTTYHEGITECAAMGYFQLSPLFTP